MSATRADLARGRLREKIPALQLALHGRLTDHHRWRLRLQWEQLAFLESQIARLDEQIQAHVTEYQDAITLCTTIPGIEEVAAANLVAEIGVNMEQFPSTQHLASWAGLCPGNHESAGKRLSGTSRKGNAWLRRRSSVKLLGQRRTPRTPTWRLGSVASLPVRGRSARLSPSPIRSWG